MATLENLFSDDFQRIIAMDLYSSITQFTDLNNNNNNTNNSLDSLFLHHQQKLQQSPQILHNFSQNNSNHNNLSKKRKASSPTLSSSKSYFTTTKTGSSRRGKKSKKSKDDEEEVEKSKEREVVHVRAKRGQATDSHSLAERVRRGKINERLRCLQEMVPGCYKAMGMATMLDEIINYVQSLQNQIEFLSTKLTVASSFHDFNSETNIVDSLQRAKAHETMEYGRQVTDVHLSNCSF